MFSTHSETDHTFRTASYVLAINVLDMDFSQNNKQFLLFAQCFLLNQKIVSPFVNILDIISLFAADLEEPKIGM